jgi:hypothetical protein
MMPEIKNEFLKTIEYPKAGIEPSELVFQRGKVIGASVEVMRTGQDKPDTGWYIADVIFRDAKKKINRTLVKVHKPNDEDPQKGLQKIVPLELLERINPEIKFQIFESGKDYVLYEDKDNEYRIGLVVDMDLEDECVSVLLDEGAEDITASQDRVALSNIIDKSDNPRQLEKFLQKKAD